MRLSRSRRVELFEPRRRLDRFGLFLASPLVLAFLRHVLDGVTAVTTSSATRLPSRCLDVVDDAHLLPGLFLSVLPAGPITLATSRNRP